MRNFISSYQLQSFRVINLDSIAYVDFSASDDHPNTPDRCTIYFTNSTVSVAIDNPNDAQGLLEAMSNYH